MKKDKERGFVEMEATFKTIQALIAVIGGYLGFFIGGLDGLVIVLIVCIAIDYVTGVMCAVVDKKLSSKIGFKGICRKILIVLLVGIANMVDIYVIKSGSMLRTAAIFFYISNEGISILENAGHLGLPIPTKIKDVLVQLHKKAEGEDKDKDDQDGDKL